jgi:hypothetical protein
MALFPLLKPIICETARFRRDSDHHVHVIRLQMPVLDPAFLLRSQLAKYFPSIIEDSQIPSAWKIFRSFQDRLHSKQVVDIY